MSKVATYSRVSTLAQDIDRQHAQHEHAARQFPDCEVVAFEDDGVSAFKVSIFDRPDGRKLVKLIEKGEVVAVLSDAQDRLSRGKQSEWWQFVDLCEQTGTRIFIDGREIRPWEDEGDELKSALDAMIARRESRTKSNRTRSGKAHHARKGRPNGGPRRFGFERGEGRTGVLVPIPAEVAVVRRMFEGYVGGLTQRQIAMAANEAGARTARGNLWSQSQVSQVLADPIWIGVLKNAEGEFQVEFDGELIPRSLWDAVQATRPQAKERAGRRSERFLVANGMLRCGCGAAMRAKQEMKPTGSYEVYICSGRYDGTSPDCAQPAIRRERVDGAVLSYFASVGLDIAAMIEERGRSRAHRLADLASRTENAERLRVAAERKIERLDAALAEGLDPADYKRAIDTPKQELAAAEGALEDLRAQKAAVNAEPDLGEAEQEVLEQLAELRAAVAGEIAGNAEDLRAAQAALRRTFSRFELTAAGEEHHGEDLVETGVGYLIEPVVRPEMLALSRNVVPWHDVQQTPLELRGGSNFSRR